MADYYNNLGKPLDDESDYIDLGEEGEEDNLFVSDEQIKGPFDEEEGEEEMIGYEEVMIGEGEEGQEGEEEKEGQEKVEEIIEEEEGASKVKKLRKKSKEKSKEEDIDKWNKILDRQKRRYKFEETSEMVEFERQMKTFESEYTRGLYVGGLGVMTKKIDPSRLNPLPGQRYNRRLGQLVESEKGYNYRVTPGIMRIEEKSVMTEPSLREEEIIGEKRILDNPYDVRYPVGAYVMFPGIIRQTSGIVLKITDQSSYFLDIESLSILILPHDSITNIINTVPIPGKYIDPEIQNTVVIGGKKYILKSIGQRSKEINTKYIWEGWYSTIETNVDTGIVYNFDREKIQIISDGTRYEFQYNEPILRPITYPKIKGIKIISNIPSINPEKLYKAPVDEELRRRAIDLLSISFNKIIVGETSGDSIRDEFVESGDKMMGWDQYYHSLFMRWFYERMQEEIKNSLDIDKLTKKARLVLYNQNPEEKVNDTMNYLLSLFESTINNFSITSIDVFEIIEILNKQEIKTGQINFIIRYLEREIKKSSSIRGSKLESIIRLHLSTSVNPVTKQLYIPYQDLMEERLEILEEIKEGEEEQGPEIILEESNEPTSLEARLFEPTKGEVEEIDFDEFMEEIEGEQELKESNEPTREIEEETRVEIVEPTSLPSASTKQIDELIRNRQVDKWLDEQMDLIEVQEGESINELINRLRNKKSLSNTEQGVLEFLHQERKKDLPRGHKLINSIRKELLGFYTSQKINLALDEIRDQFDQIISGQISARQLLIKTLLGHIDPDGVITIITSLLEGGVIPRNENDPISIKNLIAGLHIYLARISTRIGPHIIFENIKNEFYQSLESITINDVVDRLEMKIPKTAFDAWMITRLRKWRPSERILPLIKPIRKGTRTLPSFPAFTMIEAETPILKGTSMVKELRNIIGAYFRSLKSESFEAIFQRLKDDKIWDIFFSMKPTEYDIQVFDAQMGGREKLQKEWEVRKGEVEKQQKQVPSREKKIPINKDIESKVKIYEELVYVEHGFNVRAYLENLFLPILYLEKLGNMPKIFKAKTSKGIYQIEALASLSFAEYFPEIGMNLNMSEEDLILVLNSLSLIMKDIIDEFIYYYMIRTMITSKIIPLRKLDITYAYSEIKKFLVDPMTICNALQDKSILVFDTDSEIPLLVQLGGRYNKQTNKTVFRGKALNQSRERLENMGGKYPQKEIDEADLIICYDSESKKFSCHSTEDILKDIINRGGINPYTNRPYPVEFIEKIKLQHKQALENPELLEREEDIPKVSLEELPEVKVQESVIIEEPTIEPIVKSLPSQPLIEAENKIYTPRTAKKVPKELKKITVIGPLDDSLFDDSLEYKLDNEEYKIKIIDTIQPNSPLIISFDASSPKSSINKISLPRLEKGQLTYEIYAVGIHGEKLIGRDKASISRLLSAKLGTIVPIYYIGGNSEEEAFDVLYSIASDYMGKKITVKGSSIKIPSKEQTIIIEKDEPIVKTPMKKKKSTRKMVSEKIEIEEEEDQPISKLIKLPLITKASINPPNIKEKKKLTKASDDLYNEYMLTAGFDPFDFEKYQKDFNLVSKYAENEWEAYIMAAIWNIYKYDWLKTKKDRDDLMRGIEKKNKREYIRELTSVYTPDTLLAYWYLHFQPEKATIEQIILISERYAQHMDELWKRLYKKYVTNE